MGKVPMNAALFCRSVSVCVSPHQFTEGIDTEEVDGSSPFGPTMSPSASVAIQPVTPALPVVRQSPVFAFQPRNGLLCTNLPRRHFV